MSAPKPTSTQLYDDATKSFLDSTQDAVNTQFDAGDSSTGKYEVNTWLSGFKGMAGETSFYGFRWMVQGAWTDAGSKKVNVWWSPQIVAD